MSVITIKIDTGELSNAIFKLATALAGQATEQMAPTQTPVVPTQTTTVQQAPTCTLEQLAVAATPLIDAGRQAELVDLLSQFGVQALTQLPKQRYGEFATALRGLGAKI